MRVRLHISPGENFRLTPSRHEPTNMKYLGYHMKQEKSLPNSLVFHCLFELPTLSRLLVLEFCMLHQGYFVCFMMYSGENCSVAFFLSFVFFSPLPFVFCFFKFLALANQVFFAIIMACLKMLCYLGVSGCLGAFSLQFLNYYLFMFLYCFDLLILK